MVCANAVLRTLALKCTRFAPQAANVRLSVSNDDGIDGGGSGGRMMMMMMMMMMIMIMILITMVMMMMMMMLIIEEVGNENDYVHDVVDDHD